MRRIDPDSRFVCSKCTGIHRSDQDEIHSMLLINETAETAREKALRQGSFHKPTCWEKLNCGEVFR